MKTKIELGNSVKSLEHTSGSMLDILWFSGYSSVDSSVWSSVRDSVWIQINNSMIWIVEL